MFIGFGEFNMARCSGEGGGTGAGVGGGEEGKSGEEAEVAITSHSGEESGWEGSRAMAGSALEKDVFKDKS